MKNLLLLSLLIISFNINSQTIKGNVLDIETQKPIEFATVIDETNSYQSTTDADGNFIIKFSKSGTYTLVCKHVSYQMQSKTVKLKENEKVEIEFLMQIKTENLDEVIVISPLEPTKKVGDALFTGTQINKSGLDLMGVSNTNSVYNSLNLIPSVSYQATDAYGLAEKSMRIRGVRNMFNGVTIEGIPNYGIMPVGARDDVYDVENIQSIALYKGAVPIDVLAATGNRGGTIDITLNRPEDKMGFDTNVSIGSNEYKRTYLRFDTGKILQKTNLYGSYSFTTADKWKGFGKLGKRNHFNFGLKHEFSEHLKLGLFGNWNEIDRHFFKPLNSLQIQDLEANYLIDYDENLTKIPSKDINYFDYNKGNFKNQQYIGAIEYKINDDLNISLKGYYNDENSLYHNTLQNGTQYLVQDKTRKLNQWGFIADHKGKFKILDYALGIWYESFDNLPYVYNNQITATGLNPKGYAFFTAPIGRGNIMNPYLKLAYTFGKFKIQAGLKYMNFYEPETERYLALNANELKPNPEIDMHTDAIQQNALLPAVGLGYSINDKIEIYANYGKNYMRPYMYVPTVSAYLQNRNAFLSHDMSLQTILDHWKMETSDNFDFGVMGKYKKFRWNVSSYYSKQKNILATVLDPIVNVNYGQNVGSLTAYGAETELEFAVNKYVNIFANPSYTKISYDENITLKTPSGAAEIEIKGNQSPATPLWMLKTGAFANYKKFNLNTIFQYTGERFGDATNIEKVDAYWNWDATLNYFISVNGNKKGLTLGIELKNILDTKYVGIIDVSDESQNGKASYFTGFPRTFVFQLKFDY